MAKKSNFTRGSDRSLKLKRERGLRGSTFGPAGPAVSLVTGKIFLVPHDATPSRQPIERLPASSASGGPEGRPL